MDAVIVCVMPCIILSYQENLCWFRGWGSVVLCHQGRFAEALLWFVRFQLICSELLLMPCHAEPFRGKLRLFLGASQLVMIYPHSSVATRGVYPHFP